MTDSQTNRDPSRPAVPPPFDDEALGALVRDVAGGWVAPPRRLGQSTWRDLVAEPGGRRFGRGRDGGTGWVRRLVGASVAAVSATVALALVAVWLTTPRSPGIVGATPSLPSAAAGLASNPAASSSGAAASSPAAAAPSSAGSSPSSSVGSSSSPTPAVTAQPSPLPTIAVFGAPIANPRVLVGVGSDFRFLDLDTGQLGPAVATRNVGRSEVWPVSGGYLCACVRQISALDQNGQLLEGFGVQIRRIGADGTLVSEIALPDYTAHRIPNATQNSPLSVDIWVRANLDRSRLFVGWSKWSADGWLTGLDVVNTTTGRIVQSLQLPVIALKENDVPVVAWSPQAMLAPDGRHAVILSVSYEEQSGIARQSRRLATMASDGRISLAADPSPFGTALDTSSCESPIEGFATNEIYYALCRSSTPKLQRFALDGSSLGATDLGDNAGSDALSAGGGPVIDQTRGLLYLWDAFKHRLTVVDANSGAIVAALGGPTAQGGGSPLEDLAARFGRWLAPTAAAKVYLQPSVVLSPDGSTLYALGVTATSFTEPGGSSGIFVFDLRSYRLIANWKPLADWWSLALSTDGTILFAAGMPEANAAGERTDQPASVVGLDSTTGEVRVIAGALTGQADFALHYTP